MMPEEWGTKGTHQDQPSCSTRTKPFLFAFHLDFTKIFIEQEFSILKKKFVYYSFIYNS